MLRNNRAKQNGERWGDWGDARRPATQAMPVQRPAAAQRPFLRPAPQPRPAEAPRQQPSVTAAPAPSQSAADTTVSINIQLPSLNVRALKRSFAAFFGRLWNGLGAVWSTLTAHKAPVLAVLGIVVVAGAAVALWPGHKPGSGSAITGSGSHSGTSAGAGPKLAKPDFTVLVPKAKPQLATPNGKTSAFDGTRDSFSFVDSIQNYGFVVSEQALPKNFSSGKEAVSKIAPTLIANAEQAPLTISSGTAMLLTSKDNGTQSIVASVGDVLLFIRSSHGFDAGTWANYLSSLQ